MSFVGWFLLLVVGLGFAELYLLVGAAGLWGFWPTLGMCVFTGVVGGSLVRSQGLRTLGEIQTGLSRGQLPQQQIGSGLVLLLVGAMLIVPGFITDILGFSMLIPPVRLATVSLLARLLEKRINVGGFPSGGPSGPAQWPGPTGQAPWSDDRAPEARIIDVEPESKD